MKNITFDRKLRRKKRVKNNISGTKGRPRISVFRSNRQVYAQAIDDRDRKTLAHFSSSQLKKNKDFQKAKKTEEAKEVGKALAKLMREKKITTAVFDRNVYAYKGRVKALADGLREGGIKI